MLRLIRTLLLFSVLIATPLAAKAEEIFEYIQYPRWLGMGGVRVIEEDDAGVMMYNPAGLAFVKGIHWDIFNLPVGTNALSVASDLASIGNVSNLLGNTAMYGKNMYLGAGGHTSIVTPYFGLAGFDSGYMTFRLENPAFPNMTLTTYNDYGFVMGGAVPLGPTMGLGLSVKRIVRTGGSAVLGPDVLSNASSLQDLAGTFSSTGTALGLDLGFMFKAPVPGSPTVSLAWQDLGTTSFTLASGTTNPPVIRDNLTLGITSSGSSFGFGYATGVEFRHLMDYSEPLGKKVHLGLELSMGPFDIRGGFYQGWTSYGLGLDLWLMQMDLASYSIEKGLYPGQTQDQRIQFGLSMNFSFDPNFKILDSGGKKRRLKQRR